MTPAQALLHYTAILSIERTHYCGPVYNMTVAEDNSYTVNGAVVHNCMCRYEDVLMDKASFQAQVQGWLRGDSDFLDGYSTWLMGRYAAEPLPWDMPLAEKLEMWLSAGIDPESVGMDVKAALAAGR